MGGAGSGNRWRDGGRQKCEDLLDLRIPALRKYGLLEPGRRGNLGWTVNGRSAGSIGIFANEGYLELTYRHQGPSQHWRDVHEIIALDSTEQHFGGERRWFVCPACDRRCAVLYGDEHFRCRQCQRLAYRSQSEDPRFRSLSKARKVRRRLGESGNLVLPFPDKPPGMHWATYDRLYVYGMALERASLRAFAAATDKLRAGPRGRGNRVHR